MSKAKFGEKNSNKKLYIIMFVCFYVVLLLICFHIGYKDATMMKTADRGMMSVIEAGLDSFSSSPFACFPIQSESWSYVGIVSAIYLIAIFLIWAEHEQNRHDRAGQEHGSAEWYTDFKEFSKIFSDPIGDAKNTGRRNVILAMDLMLSIDGRKTDRSLNELCIGGTGTGKSRYKVKPNLLQANTSYVVTDPSGELLRSHGKAMQMLGHDVKVLNLVNMAQSNNYNPFDYIERKDQSQKELDVTKTVDLIMANTSDPNASKGEAFWDDSMKALYAALMHLLIDFGRPQDQNFETVLKYIRKGRVEENQKGKSELEQIFDNAREKEKAEIEAGIRHYHSKAFTNWEIFKLAGVKTAQSILISASVRIQKFDNIAVAKLTKTDYERPSNNINFSTTGDKPTVIFVITPTGDISFNFIVSMFYSQMFDTLYRRAESICPRKYLIMDSHDFPIQTMLDSEKEAKKRLEELKTCQIRQYNKRERYCDSEEYERMDEKKNSFKSHNTKKKKNAGKKKYAGRVMYQVYIPFTEKTKEQVTAMSYAERKEYIGKKNSGGDVIREFYSEKLAKEFIEEIQNARIQKGTNSLPWHVRFLLDEFANITALPIFSERLATMRKYGISCLIILQNLEQLKKNYKEDYGTIKGNCDTFCFLGSAEIETAREVSELLGDETIRAKGSNVSTKSTSKNFNQSGRKLLDPAEITKMNNKYCIISLRGLDPIFKRKYNLVKHPNYFLTGDANPNNEFDDDYYEIYFGIQSSESAGYKKDTVHVDQVEEVLDKNKEGISKLDTYTDIDEYVFDKGFSSFEEFAGTIHVQEPMEVTDIEMIEGTPVRVVGNMVDAAQIDDLMNIANQHTDISQEEHFYKS